MVSPVNVVKTRKSKDWEGPSLRTVLIGLSLVAVVMGVFAYYRYITSEKAIMSGMAELEGKGAKLDSEGCINEVLDWHKRCDALSMMCNDAVKIAMYHCLEARDRSEDCGRLKPDVVSKGQWVFGVCKDRGTECRRRKQCACADAYRAMDSFCRTDQKAVQL
nr:hypothetical protein [Nannocystis sp.]